MNPLETLFQLCTGFQRTAALRTAVELDLFTAIAAGCDTTAALARRLEASERGVRGLTDALVALGLLVKSAGRYGLDPELGPFLDRRSPAYIASAVRFIGSPLLTQAFSELTTAVRRGGTALEGAGTMAPENPIWVEFARAMAPLAAVTARLIAVLLNAPAAGPWRILDVAAGHGLFGVTLAEQNPRAEVTALDWANVLEVAQENARAAGLAGRFHARPGSAFEVAWGTDYDLVLLTNFLHHFDPPTCEQVFRRAHAALRPGGRAVTLEFVPDENRTAPVEAATFALVMLATTQGGDVYTFSEYERMARAAGFARSELHQLPAPQRVVISYRG